MLLNLITLIKRILLEENFNTESIITKLIDDEINYQIESISNSKSMLTLTPCVILDKIDGKIQCYSR